MSRLSVKLGFWSALLMAIAFIVYTIAFGAILISFRIPPWTGLSEFIASIDDTWYLYYTLCQLLAFLTPLLFVLVVNSLHDYAPNNKKILTRISISFAIVFTVFSSINYFIQFSAVRLNILHGQPEGLEQFIQLNPLSLITAINILGWTLFLGLSSLFIVPIFSGGRLHKVIQLSFLANGILCILGAIGYVFEILLLNILFFYGMGAAIMVIGISLSILFKRIYLICENK